MMDMLRNLWLEDDGQDLAEYGLLLIVVAVGVILVITAFREQIKSAFDSATAALKTAPAAP
jgi:Flp pilus assembly pilin Flp